MCCFVLRLSVYVTSNNFTEKFKLYFEHFRICFKKARENSKHQFFRENDWCKTISAWIMRKSDFRMGHVEIWFLLSSATTISRIFLKGMEIYQWPSLLVTHTGIRDTENFLTGQMNWSKEFIFRAHDVLLKLIECTEFRITYAFEIDKFGRKFMQFFSSNRLMHNDSFL